MSHNIKVSIILPTYNCAEYLSTAIESALNQTFKCFELIVIDDGSNDATHDLIHSEFSGVDKIRYFYQDNKGLPGARNAGIKRAEGEYITFLDADDIYKPTMLEKCHSFLETRPSHDLVITEWIMQTLDDNNNVIDEKVPSLSNYPQTQDALYNMVFTRMMFNSYMMVRKEYIKQIGLFDENIPFCEDVDLWRRFAKNGVRFDLIREPLFIYRKRTGSLTTSYSNKNIYSLLRLFDKYRSDIVHDKHLRMHHANELWHYARLSYTHKSPLALTLRCMLKSQFLQPSIYRLFKSLYSTLSRT